jgi:hypothetical protein
MYNEAIANPIFEIDPNISDDIFFAWEPSSHGSWEEYLCKYNIDAAAHNLAIKDLARAESNLVVMNDEEELNPLPLSLFNNRSGLTQLIDEESKNDSPARVEDPDLLQDESIFQRNLLRYQEDFFTPQVSRQTELRKIARGKFLGFVPKRNDHVSKLIVPSTSIDNINSIPQRLGMISSLPLRPLIPLPQITSTPSRKTVKNVKSHHTTLSITDVSDRIHQLPFSGLSKYYDGAQDYDQLRSDLVESFCQLRSEE